MNEEERPRKRVGTLDLNAFYNADCMEVMRRTDDKSVDLAIVDPPYGIGALSMTFSKAGGRQWGQEAAPHRDYRKLSDWDKKPDKSYFDELFRVSKKQIVWGVIIFQI